MREAVTLSAIGAALGLAAARGLTRLLGILNAAIFGINRWIRSRFGGVALLLSVVAILAARTPVRRAARARSHGGPRVEVGT